MTMSKVIMIAAVAVFVVGCATAPQLPPQEHWAIGSEAYYAKQYKKAIYHFQSILKDSSTREGMKPGTLYFLGETYSKMGKEKKAQKVFKELIRNYSNSSYARLVYGRQ